MPDTDVSNAMVIGVQSGHIRTTKSWILGKLFRVLDNGVDADMKAEQPHVLPDTQLIKSSVEDTGHPWEALRISVFETVDEPGCTHGVPSRDWVWFSGFAVILLQLVIAIVSISLHQEWGTLSITIYGNALALLEGSLPQWKKEKWACPKSGGSTIILTQGNGTRHATLILESKGTGLDLEILAIGNRTAPPSRLTRFAVAILTANWIILLITAAGLRLNTWCK
jgi:hypothetical protein